MKFKKFGVIKYPEYIDVVSIYIGKLRDLLNSEMNRDNPKFKRGDRSEFVNILGVKGELIVQNFLFNEGIDYKSVKLIAAKPVIGADIFIGDKIKIDVKTIRDDAPDLLVNKEAHEKGKGITHYWFIQPTITGQCNYWIFKFEDINEWKIKNLTFSDGYFIPISELIKMGINGKL